MKNLIKIASIALLMFIAFAKQESQAQIFGEYQEPRYITGAPYVTIGSGGTLLQASAFQKQPVGVQDQDAGYAQLAMPFPFSFNGEDVPILYISVNGFVQVSTPNNLPQDDGNGLFTNNPSTYPGNVIAPFWGNHVYRTSTDALVGNYTPTQVRWKVDGSVALRTAVLTIEWINLNINVTQYPTPSPYIDNNSIATFQLKIYQSPDANNFQSDLEFCYGTVGGTKTSNPVYTKGASVGLKGDFFGDYINALGIGVLGFNSHTSTKLTNTWQPTGGSDIRIRFDANRNLNVPNFWGDGDADFSKAGGQRHAGLDQNRYVTFNDVRLIMKAVVTKIPLDPTRQRQAFHGDVNHNGRYFFDINGNKIVIPAKSKNIQDNLPAGVQNIKQVFFQVSEDDAKVIIQYLSARIPSLPWVYDTIPQFGKVGDLQVANSIVIGESSLNKNGSKMVPVYLNGNHNGGVSTSFTVNGKVLSIEKNPNIGNDNFIEFYDGNIAFAGTGDFSSNEPLFYINYQPDFLNSSVEFNDVKFNDNLIGKMTTDNYTDLNTMEITSSPNPFNENTTINFNISENGQYSLVIYDLLGNKVKDILNNNLTKGTISRNWDGTDNLGNNIESGVYVARLNGANVHLSQKIVYNK